MGRLVLGAVLLTVASGRALAQPFDEKWSVTLYGGPATIQYFSNIIGGHYSVDGGMVGLALDRRLFNLGWGFSVGAEVQLTQFAFGQTYTTAALGLGIRFDNFPWSRWLPTRLSVYSGPSYTPDPPPIINPIQGTAQHPFLNYVGLELAFSVPHSEGWAVALRAYHRSGAWGVYTLNDDEGSAVGLGISKGF